MMPVGQVNANDPRVKRTRQLLQQTLLDLMREKSFTAITVQDLAERSTLNRATFYAHFDNKEALLDETIRISFLQMVERRLPTGHVSSSADLEPIIVAVCEFLKQLNGKCWQQQRRFGVLVEREMKALLTGILRVWLAELEAQPMRDGASADLTATMASWAIYGAALHWSYQDVRQPEEELARAVQTVIARVVMLGER